MCHGMHCTIEKVIVAARIIEIRTYLVLNTSAFDNFIKSSDKNVERKLHIEISN